jgi:hypothetical protein
VLELGQGHSPRAVYGHPPWGNLHALMIFRGGPDAT